MTPKWPPVVFIRFTAGCLLLLSLLLSLLLLAALLKPISRHNIYTITEYNIYSACGWRFWHFYLALRERVRQIYGAAAGREEGEREREVVRTAGILTTYPHIYIIIIEHANLGLHRKLIFMLLLPVQAAAGAGAGWGWVGGDKTSRNNGIFFLFSAGCCCYSS